jgi:hypothetical protein
VQHKPSYTGKHPKGSMQKHFKLGKWHPKGPKTLHHPKLPKYTMHKHKIWHKWPKVKPHKPTVKPHKHGGGHGAEGVVWGIIGCAAGTVTAAVVKNYKRQQELTAPEAWSCGIEYFWNEETGQYGR